LHILLNSGRLTDFSLLQRLGHSGERLFTSLENGVEIVFSGAAKQTISKGTEYRERQSMPIKL